MDGKPPGNSNTCAECDGTGVIDTGNNDLPCDRCSAGDRALFNEAGVRGTVTGAQVKRHFLNGSPEPLSLDEFNERHGR